MQVGEFKLADEAKVQRAIYGTTVEQGRVIGGVGEKASPEAVLAEYDKLGGLVLKDGLKVKTGSFYDFLNKKPRTKPEVSFQVSYEGSLLETSEQEAKGIQAAAEKLESLKKKKKSNGEVPEGRKRIRIKDVRDEE